MNEGRGYDDARAKVLCDEEGRLGHSHALGPSKRDGDYCAQETADQDDEDGAYAKTKAAIVVVAEVYRCRGSARSSHVCSVGRRREPKVHTTQGAWERGGEGRLTARDGDTATRVFGRHGEVDGSLRDSKVKFG